MATANGKSVNIAFLDQTAPFVQMTAGEGRAARLKMVEDKVALDAAGLGDTGSYYRVCRLPANAKVKRLDIFTDAALDTNATPTLSLDFGVVFSDSTIDGTPVAYQGQAPHNAKNGTVVSPTDPNHNKLFGSKAIGAQLGVTEITFNGNLVDPLTLMETPLVDIFNFVTGQGYPQSGPGFMDVLVKVGTAAATANAGNLYVRAIYSE